MVEILWFLLRDKRDCLFCQGDSITTNHQPNATLLIYMYTSKPRGISRCRNAVTMSVVHARYLAAGRFFYEFISESMNENMTQCFLSIS